MDDKTSLEELKSRVQRFCEERDWDRYHGPKDLAIGVITEASELLEHFRFLSDDQAAAALEDAHKRRAMEQELADVLFFLLRFAQRFGVDLSQALLDKLDTNAERYPVDKARGKNLKYSDL